MQTIPNCPSRILQIAATIFALVAFAASARADIYQWEYINPADPSQGKQQSTTLCPDGAGVEAVPRADLSFFRNLTMAYLIGADLTGAGASFSNLTDADLSQANLTNASFGGATLTGADFTGAEIRGARLDRTPFWGLYPLGTGITLPQLYSTITYKAHDLSGIGFRYNGLAGGNFAYFNLSNADFYYASLTGADFRGANLTNANLHGAYLVGANLTQAKLTNVDFSVYWCDHLACYWETKLWDADLTAADARGAGLAGIPANAITTNLIRPNGHISGLDLVAGDLLVVRDYDGPSSNPTLVIPVTVDQHLAMGPGGTLRMVFEADDWDSTISFAPGIPVTLGGTLELTLADDVNPATQVGRTFDLFDWTGVNPTGAFAVSSPYIWDLTNLYITGEVMITAVPEPTTLATLIFGVLLLLAARRACVGHSSVSKPWQSWTV